MFSNARYVVRVVLLLHVLVLVLLLTPRAASGQTCALDKQQVNHDYGFWFEQSVERWQTFTPGTGAVCRLDLLIARQGSPGNLHVELRDAGGALLREAVIAQDQVPLGSTWNAIEFSPAVTVAPGGTYKVLVRSDATSPDPSNRYFWMGRTDTWGLFEGQADVWETWPGYAYAIRTYGNRLRVCGALDGSFLPTGGMSVTRAWHTATVLQDGSVLIAGGFASGEERASAEVYDPVSGLFAPTDSMSFARSRHAAVRLANGTVLVAGGTSAVVPAEIYDPATDTFSSVGTMSQVRSSSPTGTLLLNGLVLVTGGNLDAPSADLYNPAGGGFAATGPPRVARAAAVATRLADGRVLVTGGYTASGVTGTAEIYDPSSGLFHDTGSMSVARYMHSATLLGDGTVLIAGGNSTGNAGDEPVAAEVYDPAEGTFQPVGAMSTGRYASTASLLPDGRVLLAGGYVAGNALGSTEVYNPATRTFSAGAQLNAERYLHTASTLASGEVLLAGGWYEDSAERLVPGCDDSTRGDFTGDLKSDILWYHTTRGEVWLWPMNGGQSAAQTHVSTVAEPGWEIRGLGDQTGDRQADILWRHAPTGMLYLWTMDGSAVEAETYLGTVDTAFDIVGTGDYNGDGKSDILWRRLATGQVWLWLMDGPALQSVHYVDTVDPAYEVRGSGDLNGDGKADIVWQHAGVGDVWAWLMNGPTPAQVAYVSTVGDLDYRVVGVADYTGDGKADLLWHHATRGEVWLWSMDGTTVASKSHVSTVPEAEYRIAGTGDYNGDGKADILWHHATRGEVWVWLMNGAVKLSEHYVGTVPDVEYEIVAGGAQAATPITFAGLASMGSPVTSYAESGFTVVPDSPHWVAYGYGAPGPSIVFSTPSGTTETRSVEITAGGRTFSFTAVDLYSSVTTIPYEIAGLRDSVVVFSMTGTVPNTYGNFRTVLRSAGREMIDALIITLTNQTSIGPNPMGLDNIILRR